MAVNKFQIILILNKSVKWDDVSESHESFYYKHEKKMLIKNTIYIATCTCSIYKKLHVLKYD